MSEQFARGHTHGYPTVLRALTFCAVGRGAGWAPERTSGAAVNGRCDQPGRAQGRAAVAGAGTRARGGPSSSSISSSPFTYLAAERVDRAFEDVVWTPASAAALLRGPLGEDPARAGSHAPGGRGARRAAAAPALLARALPGRRAGGDAGGRLRVRGRSRRRLRPRRRAARVLRRLRPRGPGDPGRGGGGRGHRARGLPAAARDSGRDGAIEASGRRLLAAGADRLPALRVGRALYWGEDRLSDAALAARRRRARRRDA